MVRAPCPSQAHLESAAATSLPCSATPAKGVCGDADLMCFLDPTCLTEGGTGCNAGCVGQECRFCGNGGGAPPCPGGAFLAPRGM